MHGGIDALALQCLAQQRLDALAHRLGEAVARQEYQAGIEAAVDVAAQEQARARALLQRQHRHRGIEELAGRGLQHLVARQGFQNMAQRLAAVSGRLQAGVAHHRLVLAAAPAGCPTDARCRPTEVNRPRKRSSATGLACWRRNAGCRCSPCSPGDARSSAHWSWSGSRPCRPRCPARRAPPATSAGAAWLPGSRRMPRPGALDREQHVFAAVANGAVLAIAEEGEVVIRGPAQEFLQLERALRHPPASARAASSPAMVVHASRASPTSRARRRERRAARSSTAVGHARHFLGVGAAVDLEVHERLDATACAGSGFFVHARAHDHRRRGRPAAPDASTACTRLSQEAIAMVTESTRNGMSSVSTCTTVWVDSQPCSARFGLYTRTASRSPLRTWTKSSASRTSPAQSATSRATMSSSGTRRSSSFANVCAMPRRAALNSDFNPATIASTSAFFSGMTSTTI